MIKYRCFGDHRPLAEKEAQPMDPLSLHKKDRVYMDITESQCPVCKNREYVEVESQLYWCKKCSIPLYEPICGCCETKGTKFAKDCRIVFPEEKLLLELILNLEIGSLNFVSIWNGSGNIYYADGKRFPVSITELSQLSAERIQQIRQGYEENVGNMDTAFFEEMLARFVKGNRKRFESIETEAIEYIRKVIKDFQKNEMFVSFSGGKDSTVVADLVRRGTTNGEVLHIFGDTTLEFPETYKYIKMYRKQYPKVLMFSSENKDKDFGELCKVLGPPSRVMRWCCTIFKTGAINRKIEALFKKKSKVLSFQGIRRSESTSRSKYERTSRSSKIGQQIAAAPIIDWFDFDVWLYIATTGILFNPAYRLGYARVGCWCCPNNSSWSEFLSKVHMPKEYEKFHNMLMDFAISVGKPDPEVYVDQGKWKARQGGNGLAFAQKSIVKYTPCVKESDALNYTLTRPITHQLFELFKPFGKVMLTKDRFQEECLVMDVNAITILRLQGKVGEKELKIIIDRMDLLGVNTFDEAKRKIDCQITKYQMCLGCRACESVCKFGAIRVSGKEEMADYYIDENLCVHCQECVGHFSVGCYMRKVMTIKR